MKFGLFSLFDFFQDRQDEGRYYQDTLDLVIRSEQLGFDAVWLGEEHFYSFGICPSPQLFLTALARETTTLRLGTAISLLPFENPLRKAEDFAMLDLLSNGRLDFGAGRGGIPKHFEGFCIEPQESRARYEEALDIIRRAWTQERFSYQGQFWQVPELAVSPKPVQKPHPPIYRGTLSLESFETAGRLGDNAFVVPWLSAPHPEVRRRVERYRALLKEHGHSGQQETFIFFLFVDPDRQRALDEARHAADAAVQAAVDAARDAFNCFGAEFVRLGLPSAPQRLIVVHDDPFRPQPRLDRALDDGMATSVGRLRADSAFDNGLQYVLLSHNTKMGAAKGTVLTAELLAHRGYIG